MLVVKSMWSILILIVLAASLFVLVPFSDDTRFATSDMDKSKADEVSGFPYLFITFAGVTHGLQWIGDGCYVNNFVEVNDILQDRRPINMCASGISPNKWDWDNGNSFVEFSPDGTVETQWGSGTWYMMTNENFIVYHDPKRKVGSQSEVPSFEIMETTIRVYGYQKFDIKNNVVDLNRTKYHQKFDWIRNKLQIFVQDENIPTNTFMDIGCNAGLTSFLAFEVGFQHVTSLDHDGEYIKMLEQIVALEKNTVIHPKEFSFGEPFPQKSDVVFVGALIHWVFTCTANFGKFDAIMDYLSTVVSEVLLIEWVDPQDDAIQSFHHNDHCNTVHHEPYEAKLFVQSLQKLGNIIDVWPLPGKITRVIYTKPIQELEGITKYFYEQWGELHSIIQQLEATRSEELFHFLPLLDFYSFLEDFSSPSEEELP